MKLVYKKDTEQVTLAEFNGNNVTILNPALDRVINSSVTLPALRLYKDKFGGNQVKNTHEKWAVAVKIYLELNVISQHPDLFEWINSDITN